MIYSPASGELVGPDGVKYIITTAAHPNGDAWKAMLAAAAAPMPVPTSTASPNAVSVEMPRIQPRLVTTEAKQRIRGHLDDGAIQAIRHAAPGFAGRGPNNGHSKTLGGGGMPRVFMSHSSRDNRPAIAVVRWLEPAEPSLRGEVFLDLDQDTGIRAGQRWTDALWQANARCEAVICLLSKKLGGLTGVPRGVPPGRGHAQTHPVRADRNI